jgi:hypothetical protein
MDNRVVDDLERHINHTTAIMTLAASASAALIVMLLLHQPIHVMMLEIRKSNDYQTWPHHTCEMHAYFVMTDVIETNRQPIDQ